MKPIEQREPRFGPVGDVVHKRSYAMTKPSGEKETWAETARRVVNGNLSLVDSRFEENGEHDKLLDRIFEFEILPAGRHLSMTGKPGRQFLYNCFTAGWHKEIARHFVFTFDQLMQGGGVGATYSDEYFVRYPRLRSKPELHIVCDPEHPNYDEMGNWISQEYSHTWSGSYRIADSREGWCDALQMVMESFWSPDDEVIVLDMSLIRPRGQRIRTFGGTASGPAYLAKMLWNIHALLSTRVGAKLKWDDAMLIDHFIAECVVSGNVRRSARMSMKWWKDPDILDFIHCKKQEGLHWTTNISVLVDEDFFRALRMKDSHAVRVFEEATTGMLTNGEPGFFNASRASEGELEKTYCTNPCGEIAMEEWEQCCLGHINLDAHCDPATGEFDFEKCAESIRLVTRFLIRATFGDTPSPLTKRVLDRNRRIGVGFTGFHGWLAKQGIRWSECHHNPHVRKTLKDLYEVVRKEARRFSFQLRIPEPIKVTTLAPCGTVSKLPGCSESLEPIKFRYFEQRIRFDPEDSSLEELRQQGYEIEEARFEPNTAIAVVPCKNRLLEELEFIHGPEKAEWVLEEAAEIPFEDMLAVQQMIQQEFADNAISFTVNRLPDAVQQKFIEENPDWSWEGKELPAPDRKAVSEVAVTIRHFLPRLKGLTVMVDGARSQAPFTQITKEQYDAAVTKSVAESSDEECATGACEWAGAEVNERELT